MELTDSLKTLLIETAKSLKGSARRVFMARTVKELGPGGQQRAARELRWGRMTIRKGMRELASGVSTAAEAAAVAPVNRLRRSRCIMGLLPSGGRWFAPSRKDVNLMIFRTNVKRAAPPGRPS